jgi:hypothetical protein
MVRACLGDKFRISMTVPIGETPIRYYQRRLIRGLAALLLGFLCTMVVTAIIVPGKIGLGIGMFASIVLGLILLAREALNPPRCPSCRSEAVHSVEADKQWRHRFPYGWAIVCRSCGTRFDRPWDGVVRITQTSS